jgi:cytochrome P450
MSTRSKPPGPRGTGVRQLRRMRRDPLDFFLKLPARYGPLARVRFGPVRLIVVVDPALVIRVLVDDADGYKKGMALERARAILGDGLLTSEGDLHRRQLRLIGPAFSPRRVAGYERTIGAIVDGCDAGWRDGASIDVCAEMSRLALGIVVATLFGGQLESGDAERVSAGLTGVMEHFDWLVTHPLGTLRLRVPTPRVRRLLAARAELRAVVDRLVTSHVAPDGGMPDLLADLIAARDEVGGIDNELLRNEVLTLLLAGHETTANWLTFTWLALAEHPDVAVRLRRELDAELGDRPATLADRDRLPFTHAVLQETLRLFPPAWGVGRRARSARELGGYAVPAGTVVSACQYVVHRDPALWDAPERFDPDRWLDGRADGVPRGGFFPFSDGPRRCIGEHFARAEAVLILATLARRWEFHRISDEPVGLDPKVTLRPRGPQIMRTVLVSRGR